jgi:diguanylate cyclase (GGDEF)-like protein
VVRSANERAACAVIAREISRAFAVPAWLIEQADGGDHRVVAEAGRDTTRHVDQLLRMAAAAAFDRRGDRGALASIDLGAFTAIPLGDAERMSALVVAGKTASLGAALSVAASWLPGALAVVRERDQRANAGTLPIDLYKLARRASRSREIDAVCQHVVDQAARTVAAERVAIAVYRPDEHRLMLAAASGYALATVNDVRIEPGEWVMGHVYASRRSVVVRDVRRLRVSPAATGRYRSFSFAAVPIVAEGRVVGVLSATDKIDDSTFTRQDVAALRAIGGVAALGLTAAHSSAEAIRLTHAATIDSLTGLFNRRAFDLRLRQEIERAKRSSGTLAVLMIDIDDFKAINDTHGHPVGDAVLKAIADVLRSVVRVFDFCARYGGDEFAIVMPNSERATSAAAAERIRERIATSYEREAHLAELRRVTVSIGVATMSAGETAEEIVQHADDSLYRAKAAGKNCVQIAPARASSRLRLTAGRVNERSKNR